jgi:hypothetical protein
MLTTDWPRCFRNTIPLLTAIGWLCAACDASEVEQVGDLAAPSADPVASHDSEVKVSDGETFLAVFQSGAAPETYSQDSQSWHTHYRSSIGNYPQGLRVKGIDVHRNPISCFDGDTDCDHYLYTVLWGPGSGAELSENGSYSRILADSQKQYDKGMRLASLDREGDQFFALWKPGTGTQAWWTEKSQADFLSISDDQYQHGKRVISAVESAPGKYTFVVRPGTWAQWILVGADWASFAATDQQQFTNGLRLASLDVRDGRYTAVWRSGLGNGAQWVHTGITHEQLWNLTEQYRAQGIGLAILRPMDFTECGRLGEVTCLAFNPGDKYCAPWLLAQGSGSDVTCQPCGDRGQQNCFYQDEHCRPGLVVEPTHGLCVLP